MTKKLNREYWSTRYKEGNTGWDLKEVSPPLKAYIDRLDDKNIKILIPGGGNAHEAAYLFKKGFKNVYVLDISELPLQAFARRNPEFLEQHLIHANFFEMEDTFDLILEQTFFCALDPSLRTQYVEKMNELLTPHGKLVGLLFNFPLTEAGPPFGGSIKEYMELFSDAFDIQIMETAHNSIKPREGKELFIHLTKKK